MGRPRDLVLENLAEIRRRISVACESAARDPSEIAVVAIGKTVEAEALRWVVEAGVRDLGENYVQELRAKVGEVPGARWHFVGTLQSSSAHHVADLVSVVETVVPGRAAERLARRASGAARTIPVLVEVDFTAQRSGVRAEETVSACDQVAALEGLELRGLMTVPPPSDTAEAARPYFERLRTLRDDVADRHPGAIELSMGMSLDYEVAVGEGATMVRIGTALFGARPRA